MPVDSWAGYLEPDPLFDRVGTGHQSRLNELQIKKKRANEVDYDLKYNRKGFFKDCLAAPYEPFLE